ncbi:hypothetical protein [Cellulosilyticum sp. I15G10I2]|uniref:hypothetical protein n=1 Tax=Cellulosilyticum sp. I15G10I2 TaxID=1892843 RepID=UPI00114CB2D9|nr:hypothetical protein [Cellulosilyticum sp. I15G10I2]
MQEVLQAAIDKWGKDMQLTVATEELAELIKEICKYVRGIGNKEHLAEEVADVEIVLSQLEIIYGKERAIKNYTSNYSFKSVKRSLIQLMDFITDEDAKYATDMVIWKVRKKTEWLKDTLCLHPDVYRIKIQKIERLATLIEQ